MEKQKSKPIWVNWKYETRNGKRTKPPVDSKTGRCASVTDSNTWSDYETAVKASSGYEGIGLILTEGLCCIDIDEAGMDYADEIIATVGQTYVEISPNGGYHIFFYCDIDKLGYSTDVYYQRQNGIECYFAGQTSRYMTVTENMKVDEPINDCTDGVKAFLNKFLLKPVIKALDTYTQGEREILELAGKAKNAVKFNKLYYHGDMLDYGDDRSRADIGLCSMLAFYTQDHDLIDSLFRKSALYRDKWNREDYRTATTEKAIQQLNGSYYRKPGRPPKSENKEKPLFTIEFLSNYLKEQGYTLRYNVITREAMLEGFNVSKECSLAIFPTVIYDELQQKGITCGKNLVIDYLDVICLTSRYNPVWEILEATKWDGIDRLPILFDILNLPENDTLSRRLIFRFIWQAIALALNDDGKYGTDGVLVLQGPQRIGKTTFARCLAMKPELFLEGQYLNFSDKDTLRRCGSALIVELGELDGTTLKDIPKLKAFITSSTDRYRLPYGKNDCIYARRASLIGTCNTDDYLTDPTGNLRFWTVPVTKIDHQALREFDFVQLWVQIYQTKAKRNMQGYRLTTSEHDELSQRNKGFEKVMPGEETVKDIISHSQKKDYMYMTVTEFKTCFKQLLGNMSDAVLGKVLNKLGIKQELQNNRRVRLLPTCTSLKFQETFSRYIPPYTDDIQQEINTIPSYN